MKKYLVVSGIIAVILLLLAGGFWYVNYLKKQPSSSKNVKNATLSHEDIVNITKPSVVRLIQHVKGKAELPDLKIDFAKFDIIPDPSKPRRKVDIDEYLTGSGFVVNSNGYILTNSHVVSYQTIKTVIAGLYATQILQREAVLLAMSGKKDPTAGMNSLKVEEVGKQLGEKMLDYLIKEGKFELDKKIVVLNPSANTNDKEKMFNEGFPARMVSVNDNFLKDNRDAALVKIDKDRLPAVKLGDSSGINVGNKVMVFGFPASAEFNNKNFLESTFTDGTINSLKDSENKDFKIFQSDAKISQGSSGGPMINEQGQVIGLITYESSDSQRSSGDNFAFALPITNASSWISNSVVSADLNPTVLNDASYSDYVVSGLKFAAAKHCRKAISEFKLAQDMDYNFSTNNYLQGYIDNCTAIVNSGQSIDTQWDEKKQELAKINNSTWYLIIGGVVAFIVAVFVILFLMKRLKKDEQEIHMLENQTYSNPSIQKKNPVSPLSSSFINPFPAAPGETKLNVQQGQAETANSEDKTIIKTSQ